jgi:hypothetical protein
VSLLERRATATPIVAAGEPGADLGDHSTSPPKGTAY